MSLIQYLHKISVLVPSLLYLVQSDYTRAGQGAQTNTIVNGLGAIFDAEIFQITSDLDEMFDHEQSFAFVSRLDL